MVYYGYEYVDLVTLSFSDIVKTFHS